MVAGNTLLKFFSGQMLDQLREDGAARVHPSLFHPEDRRKEVNPAPFSIQIVPASTMRYHAYLQWVRMASRNFSRTAVTAMVQIRNKTKAHGAVGEDFFAAANNFYI